MTEADPQTIARDKEALKRAFSYRSLQHDTDLVFEDLDRPLLVDANRAGRALYPVASEFVLDCYYERGAIEPLVKAYSGQPYRIAARFERLLTHLQDAERADLIERFWMSIARLTRAEFIHQRHRRDHGDHTGAEEFKSYALEAYSQGIDWMTRLGRAEAAHQLTEEREALREERFQVLPPPSDLRRMDEPVFWSMVAESRSGAPTTLEQLAALAESLRAFGAADIKRFGSLYAKLMRKLYHWDVWALAYAARGGCSDDAFEAFRSWLILQGDPALVSLVVADPPRAAERVPREPDLPDGSCLAIIQQAYLERTGASLELPSIDLGKPRGREWSEDAFAKIHPGLVRYYHR
jgi:hypothetical protein